MIRVIACLLLVFHSVCYAEVKRSDKSLHGKVTSERHVKKSDHTKPKLHYSTSAPHAETKYGVDLPSFAFDYSEYFSGAVIERSNDKDLHLSVFMVGHKTISTDFPFHAISTDEEVLHSWSKAIQLWDKTSHKKPQLPVTRKLTRTAETSHHSSHSTHHSSGLVCVVQNNDAASTPVYQTTAYWVHAEYDVDSTSNKNIFAILRCKLRNTALTHANLQDKELFVDIMRINSHRKGSTHQAAANSSSSANSLGASSNSNVASDVRGVVLSSFSVPWATRVVGYPFQGHMNASILDPWATAETVHSGIPVTSSVKQDISEVASKSSTAEKNALSGTSTLLCVPSIRPLHPTRAQVSMPMLVEYIEHNLLLGFSHIMLGVALDWKSAFMAKHLHVLQTYIQAGKVSVYSTALPGFDDVSGFGGVQLNDTYAEQHFVNMCLYYAKGMYNYVSIGHVEEYIIPAKDEVVQGGETFVQAVLKELVQSGTVVNSSVTASSRSTSKAQSSSIQYAPCSYALSTPVSTSTPSSTSPFHSNNLRGSVSSSKANSTTSTNRAVDKYNMGKVSGRLDVYGIEDPVNAFGSWGPGESAWGRDFFASSMPKLLHNRHHTYSVLFLPTDRVVRVEYSPSGVATGHCRSVASQQRRSKNSAYSVYNLGSGKNGTVTLGMSSSGVRQGVATMYTTASVLASPVAALFVYKGSFPAQAFANSSTATPSEADKILPKYRHVRETFGNATTSNLQKRFMSTIAELKFLTKEALAIHFLSVPKASVFNPFSDSPIPDKNRQSGEIPTRAAIKAPFWQLCNTDYLKDVIRKVFHS
eukprot:gene15618-17852_t